MPANNRSRLRVIGLGLGALSALAIGTVVKFARTVVIPPQRQRYPIRIEGVDRLGKEIVFTDAPETRLPGRYGLWFGSDAGYLRFGELLRHSQGRVVRELLEVVSGTPRRGQQARELGWYFLGPWELDLDYSTVQIPTELGPSPAWLVRPQRETTAHDWVIHVHGRSAQRAETLRGVRAVATAGWQSLVLSYRNDQGAPQSRDARYGLGQSEAVDVVSALEYAAAHGAKRVVLFGWSMGGAICLQAAAAVAERSDLPEVVGLALESPVLDWNNVLRHQASLLHLPQVAGVAARLLLGSRLGPLTTGIARPIEFAKLDGARVVSSLRLPTLLLHSADDGYVPVEPARALAAAHPDLVQFEEFHQAGHVRLWNQDPVRWERVVADWFAARTQ